jgi:transposase-like protein
LEVTHRVISTALRACASAGVRNLLALIPHADKSVVAALVRTVFAQPNLAAARQQLAEIARGMQARWPAAADLLRAAEDDVLAYLTFPGEHWTRIYSTNVLERLNREVKRRTDVVQVFPTDGSVARLAGAILMEIADEWAIERRYFSQASMLRLVDPAVPAADQAPRLAPVR